MATLNGLSIKGLKSIDGPTGKIWTGKLYIGEVLIGAWSNDFYDGADCFMLLTGYSEEKLKSQIRGRHPEWGLIPEKLFMEYLVSLTLEERLFCNLTGDSGRLLYSESDGYHAIHIEMPAEYKKFSDEEIKEKEEELIREAVKQLRPEEGGILHKFQIIRGIEDFSVGAPIMLDAILEHK